MNKQSKISLKEKIRINVVGSIAETGMATGFKATIKIHSEFRTCSQVLDASSILSLKVKEDIKQYQAPPRCVAYALKEPFFFKKVIKATSATDTGDTRGR